jgi:hypothetical protein
MKRRRTEAFSISFLDCICCGFGAVVLFYTIITAQTGVERVRRVEDLTGEVNRLDEQVLRGAKNLVVLRNTLEKTQSETASSAARATRLVEELQKKRAESVVYDSSSTERRQRIESLKAELRALEVNATRLEAVVQETPAPQRSTTAKAIANRRFITGLQVKGRRILLLVDRSASMLDADLVQIIRLRNMSEADKRNAPKWRRTVDVVSWIGENIPGGSDYQIYLFNTAATPALAGTDGRWLAGNDRAQLTKALDAVAGTLPEGGTSLANALAAVRSFSPAPDRVILITDGLPTQGTTPPLMSRLVNANTRAKLFDEAVRTVRSNLPIDIVLLPMLGDNPAAHRFWRLARTTGGAFIMPSRDWP